MQETKQRFFVFIDKLKDRLKEFAEASIPELIEVNNSDTDEFKREYLRIKSAVLGQLDTICKKADEVLDEKIINAFYSTSNYYELRNECYEKKHELDDLCHHYRQKIEETNSQDYEIKYRTILEEFESIKDKFHCIQCGSLVTIEKIYFITTYITCLACNTKNTFEPSTQAKQLEHLGRSLAEQRTKHLLKEYETSAEKSPVLYQTYLRTMFDEWNKINPDMQEEHEKFHRRLLNDFNNLNKK